MALTTCAYQSSFSLSLFLSHTLRQPPAPLIPVYFLLLMWSFMGVGIIADVFMAAIEVITSAEETVRLPDGTARTFKVGR